MPKTIYNSALEIVFLSALDNAPVLHEGLVTPIGITGREPSKPQLIDLASLGDIPAMREYTGTPNVVRSFHDKSFSVTTTVWEETDELPTKDMNGADANLMQDWAIEIKAQQDAKFFEKLVENDYAFDGTAMFADSRTGIYSGVDNIVELTGITIDAIATDLDSAITRLMSMRNSSGTLVNSRDTGLVVICPTALRGKFKTLTAAEYVAATDNNYFRGMAIQVVSSPIVGDYGNSWYLFKVDNPRRCPMLRVDVATPTVATTSPDPTNNLSLPGIQAWANYAFAPFDFMKAIKVEAAE